MARGRGVPPAQTGLRPHPREGRLSQVGPGSVRLVLAR